MLTKSKTHSSKSSKQILSVTIRHILDTDPDTSHLGEYASKSTSEFTIDRASDEFVGILEQGRDWLERVQARLMEFREDIELDSPEDKPLCDAVGTTEDLLAEYFDMNWNNREFRYFNPSDNYTGEPAEDIRKYVRQDYERMERLNAGDWCFIGICADAEIREPYMTEGKGGRTYYKTTTTESGGLWGIESDSDKAHIESIEQEELSELKTQLLALGFSKRAIGTAFKNVEREDA